MSAEDAADAASRRDAEVATPDIAERLIAIGQQMAGADLEAIAKRLRRVAGIDDETRAAEAVVVADPRNLQVIDCTSVQNALVAYVDGEIDDPSVRAVITAHVEGCLACSAALEATRRVNQLADAWQISEEAVSVSDANAHRISAGIVRSAQRAWGSGVTLTRTVGNELLEKRYITRDQLNQALEIQRAENGDIGQILMDLGFATERDVFKARAKVDGVSYIDLTKHKPDPSAIALVPERVVQKHRALPMKTDGNRLWIAVVDPQNVAAADEIHRITRLQVIALATVPFDLERAIADMYGSAASTRVAAHTEPSESGRRTPPPAAPTAIGAPGDDPQDRGMVTELVTTLRELRTEVRAVHAEMEAMRTEMAELRRQLARTRARSEATTTVSTGKRLLPFAAPADTPTRLQ